MIFPERYIVTTASGQAVVRTDSERQAEECRRRLRGHIIDRDAEVELEAVAS